MSKLTKMMLLALSAVIMLGLSACGNVTSDSGGLASWNEFNVTMKDGRSMPCVGGSHALTCDWSKLK
jgi:hypothetical protein